MNATINAIQGTIDRSCHNGNWCGECPQDGCTIKAKAVYTTHVKPLQTELAAAKERERVLVEALERAIHIIDEAQRCGSHEEEVAELEATLASVKEASHAE